MVITLNNMDPHLVEALRLLPPRAVRGLFADATARVQNRQAKESTHYIPHPPHSGRQTEFVNDLDHREILYGGAAGGGKSDGLLQSALRYVGVPRYAAVIFRRTYPRLTQADGLIMRSHEWLGGKANWNQQQHRWTFPSGATLTFAALQYDKDVFDHGGAAYQFIGWDELTEFTKYQYTFLFSRLRKPDKLTTGHPLANVPLRVRATSNPGNVGHLWVKKRFIDEPTEIRRFIPATLADNPALDRDEYVASLAELDPVTRRQLLHGDWSASEDGALSWPVIASCQVDPAGLLWPNGIVPVGHKTKHPELYMGIDVGRTTDNTVIWLWELLDGVVYCREVFVMRNKKFAEQKRQIQHRLNELKVSRCCIDKGAVGYQLAEELELEYPGIVFGVQLTRGRMGAIIQMMKSWFGNFKARIPRGSDELDEDLQLVREAESVNGLPTVTTEHAASGHGDRFWAAGLGLFAMPAKPKQDTPGVPRGYRSKHLTAIGRGSAPVRTTKGLA